MVKVYGYRAIFFCFQRDTIFVTSYLLTWGMKSSQNEVYSKRKELVLIGANSFFYEMTLIYMGGHNENNRVASPESESIHLPIN